MVLAAFFFLLNMGCSVLRPLPKKTSVAQRIAAFPTKNVPVEKAVTIYWDRHMVPFIEAESDDDLAFALGMVHAHLRLAQMEILRHASQGRLSEMAGPFAIGFDHSLRIINLGRCSKAIYANMPAETRRWLDNFTRGVNFVQDNMTVLPYEFRVCGLRREPWAPEDIIAIEHLGGADINWLQWFSLLPMRGKPFWPQLWARLLKAGSSTPSFSPEEATWPVREVLGGMTRSGSNSFAISGSRRGGAAIMANDPHLGITIPSIWLIVGMKSLSYNTVGLMFPGVPFVALGRNERIAWGGTNMHSASSNLYDISKEPADSITTREEKIKVRWWFDRTVKIRESRFGPIVSDAPLLRSYKGPPLAVRWVGHEPSDEFTAMLQATRAKDWNEFRQAFGPYALPGMNILYADADGNIGQLMAVKLPMRQKEVPDDIVLDPEKTENLWKGFLSPAQLPYVFNPRRGFLVSCNNVPVKMNPPIGYFFSAPDRFLRISALLSARSPVDLAYVRSIQRDVCSATDVELRDLLVKKIDEGKLHDEINKANASFLPALRGWDGNYDTRSTGAVAFQLIFYHFANDYYPTLYEKPYSDALLRGAGRFALDDLKNGDAERIARCAKSSAIAAAGEFGQFKDWGEMHRLQIAHMFSSIPLIGRKYRFGDYPAAGSNETVWKTAAALTNQRNSTRFGSTARHISDLSDPDENYFLVLGGQDGWINSAASLDQVPMWMSGEYIKVPLRPDTVGRSFEHKTVMGPTD